MNVSNLADVGQMRRRRGISMNMMMKAQTLQSPVRRAPCLGGEDVQAYDTEGNDKVGVEDVRDSKCKA